MKDQTPIKRYVVYAEPVYENGEMVGANCVSEERDDRFGVWVRAGDVATLTARCEALEQSASLQEMESAIRIQQLEMRCEALEKALKDADLKLLEDSSGTLKLFHSQRLP